MPLFINSLGADTHTHTHILTIHTGSILRNQACGGCRPAQTWFTNVVQKLQKYNIIAIAIC